MARVDEIGHLPLSHTFEGVAGLDHHQLGAARIAELTGLLRRYSIEPDEVIATDRGGRASVLSGAEGVLKLDHFESLVHSGRAHGRTFQPPHATLARIHVVDGCVSTDADTGRYLVELVAGEALWLCSKINAVPSGVVRHLAHTVLPDAGHEQRHHIAAMTDDEFVGHAADRTQDRCARLHAAPRPGRMDRHCPRGR